MANTPAEITHLLEEIAAKDHQISSLREEISKRDSALQKWVRVNGSHQPHPKEASFSKIVEDCYDRCEILQAEKEGLAAKSKIVLDRQIKRLDIGLRSLTAREEFPSEWGGPTLLSGTVTGVSTPVPGIPVVASGGPLQAVSANIGTGANTPNIANAAQLRMAQTAAAARSVGQTPPNAARSQRESSTEATKRRRMNPSLGNLPSAPSSLRQPSLGPGTPKPGTPNPTAPNTSRAGSAQPRPAGGTQKKAPVPVNPARKIAPHQAAAGARKRNRNGKKSSDRRRPHLANNRATPSTNASLSDGSDRETSASPTPSSLPRSQVDGAADKVSSRSARAGIGGPEDDEDDENDDQLYCYCQKVSFGDMVGCDNDNCEYQWFHWSCIGLKSEPDPKSEWLCPTCKKLPRDKVVISKG